MDLLPFPNVLTSWSIPLPGKFDDATGTLPAPLVFLPIYSCVAELFCCFGILVKVLQILAGFNFDNA